MKKLKIGIKNPFKKKTANIYIENLIRQVKPLNLKSVLIIGEGNLIASKLKKEKVSQNIEVVRFDSEKLSFKSNSFDLVICVDKLTAEQKKIYKEALRISNKYILVNFKFTPIFFIRQNEYFKLLKTRGVKILSKKITLNRMIVVVHKTP